MSGFFVFILHLAGQWDNRVIYAHRRKQAALYTLLSLNHSNGLNNFF